MLQLLAIRALVNVDTYLPKKNQIYIFYIPLYLYSDMYIYDVYTCTNDICCVCYCISLLLLLEECLLCYSSWLLRQQSQLPGTWYLYSRPVGKGQKLVAMYIIGDNNTAFALDHNIEYTIIYLFNIILPIYNYYRHHDKNGGDKIYLLLLYCTVLF